MMQREDRKEGKEGGREEVDITTTRHGNKHKTGRSFSWIKSAPNRE